MHSRPKLVREETDSLKLEGGDLIRIRHSELSAHLTSSISFEDQTPEVYFREYSGKYLEEINTLNSIWEISHSNTIFQGKKIECETDYITLRHFNSGRLIKVETEPLSGKTNLENLDLDYDDKSERAAKSRLKIIPVQKGMRYVNVDNTFRFKYDNDTNPLYLSYTVQVLSINSLEGRNVTRRLISQMNFTPLEDDFFDTNRYKAKFKDVVNVEEAYIFEKVTPTEAKDILYLRSSLFDFLNLSMIYKKGQKIKLNNQLLVEIEELLERLISFLHDVEYDPDEDFKEFMDTSEPLNTKQIIFKDLNFIEILVDLIHYPFKNHFYEVDKIHTKELYAPQVITLCYNCIRYAIMEYRPSELYASQWLNLFIEYSVGDLDDSMMANETLTELIDNNSVILETRIKKSTIHKFVSNLVNMGREKKYIDILRAICICNEAPMKVNQTIISSLILNVQDTRECLILPLIPKGGEICAKDPWTGLDQWIPLKKLKVESEARDDGKFYNFFCASIFLMSDLCQDRNYTAIDMLKNYYSVRICIEIIISDKFNFDLRSAFCNLTENMWIDANPFIIVSIPSNLKIWGDLNHQKLSKTSTKNFDNLKQFKELTTFIFDFLSDEKSLDHWGQSGFFMLQILKLCFRMFKLGFFNKKTEFKTLLDSFVRILRRTDEIIEGLGDFENKKIDYSKIEVPVIFIEIKKKICEMIKMMLKIQNDFKLTIILQKYKERYEKKRHQSVIHGNSENEELLRKSTALAKAKGKRHSLTSLLKNSNIDPSKIDKNEFQDLFESDFEDEDIYFIKKESSFISLLQKQSLYTNQALKNRSLDLIYNLYRTSSNLSERVREIQILDNIKLIDEHKNLEEIRNYLFRLGETIEMWYMQDECRELNQLNLLLRRLETNMHSIRKLNLGQDAIEGTSQSEEMNLKIEDNLFLDTHLKKAYSNLNKFSQDLARNSSCLSDILEILYHISAHDKIHRSDSRQKKEIAYYCHLILSEACFENVNNKIYLSEHFEELFLKNLDLDSHGYNVIVLLNSLLHNNRMILFDSTRVNFFLKRIFNQFLKEEKNKLRLAYYMYTIQQMIYFNSFSIRANQTSIIKNLTSSKTSHIFKNLVSNRLFETLSSDLDKGTIEFNNGDKRIQFLNDDLCFDLAFMDLISNCSFDKNAFAENISQTIISSEEVLKVLKIPEKHILFENELFKFIFHVYVETERALSSQTQNFLFGVMFEIKKSFRKVLMTKWEKNGKFYYLTHKELVSEFQVKVDLCNLIILNLKFFIKEVCKETILKIDKIPFRNFVFDIQKLVSDYKANVESEYASKKINSFQKFLNALTSKSHHFKTIIPKEKKLDLSYDELLSVAESMQEINEGEPSNTMKDIENILNKKSSKSLLLDPNTLPVNTIENPFVSKLSKKATINRSEHLVSIFRQSFMSAFQKVNLLESSKTSIFQVMSTMYFQSKSFEKLKDKEFTALIKSENYDSEIFNKFLESLIKYIDPKNKQKNEIVEIGLEIFKQFVVSDQGNSESIKERIKKIKKKRKKRKKKTVDKKTPKNEEDKEDVSNRQSQRIMKFKQDFLVKIGIVKLICRIIFNTEDSKIIKLSVEVANQILAGGNVGAQKEFFKVLREMTDKFIISKLKDELNSHFKKLANLMTRENSQTMKKMIFNQKEYDLETSDADLFEDVNSICVVIINFFQNLCEGQNKDLQNYLRIQQEEEDFMHKTKNVNIIDFMIDLFGAYVKFFNSSCFEVGNSILEFMMEAIQGPCEENQKQMMNSKVLDFCKDFMNDINSGKDLKSKGFTILHRGEKIEDSKILKKSEHDHEILDDLFTNTIQFLLSLMEGNSDKGEIEIIGNNVKIEYLLKKLRETYLREIKLKVMRSKYSKKSEEFLEDITVDPDDLAKMYNHKLFDGEVLEAFDIFFFIQTIEDHSSTYTQTIKRLSSKTKEAYDFFTYFCGHIELIFQSRLQKVYFVKHPATMYLNGEDKDLLMNEVRRENINEKLSDFLEGAPPLFDRMDHSFDLDKRCGIKPKLLENVRTLAFLVACVINIYMLLIFQKKVVDNEASLDLNSAQDWGIWFLGVFHLALALLMIVLQFLIHTEFHYYNRVRKFIKDFRKIFIPVANEEDLKDQLILAYLEKDIMKLTYNEKSRILKRQRELDSGTSGIRSPLMMAVINIRFYLSDNVLRYFLFYFICSFCAIRYENYVLYSLPLFEIIVNISFF